jgi:hypothetical protein
MKKLSLIFAAILMLSLCFVACDQNTGVEYSFSYNGTAVRIGEDGKALSAALGDYIDYRESGSCGAEQNDKEFYYPGFRYDTVWSNGADRIVRIVLTDDSVATPQGIRIGDAKSAVVTAYGDSYTETADGSLVYTDGTTKLMFGIRDGVVTAIHYTQA